MRLNYPIVDSVLTYYTVKVLYTVSAVDLIDDYFGSLKASYTVAYSDSTTFVIPRSSCPECPC